MNHLCLPPEARRTIRAWRVQDQSLYSACSTPDGFRRDARHAGIVVASAVIAATIATAPPSMIGSDARIA